jgi:hypothetical protein
VDRNPARMPTSVRYRDALGPLCKGGVRGRGEECGRRCLRTEGGVWGTCSRSCGCHFAGQLHPLAPGGTCSSTSEPFSVRAGNTLRCGKRPAAASVACAASEPLVCLQLTCEVKATENSRMTPDTMDSDSWIQKASQP